jgi:hypothetical protein
LAVVRGCSLTVANHEEYDIDRVGQEEKQELLCLSLNEAVYVFNFSSLNKNVGDSAKPCPKQFSHSALGVVFLFLAAITTSCERELEQLPLTT